MEPHTQNCTFDPLGTLVKHRVDRLNSEAQQQMLVRLARQNSSEGKRFGFRARFGLWLARTGLAVAARPELASVQKTVTELGYK